VLARRSSTRTREQSVNAALSVKDGEVIGTISAKPDGVGAACQLWAAKKRRICIADANRDYERHFIVRADELLTAFVEFERAISAATRSVVGTRRGQRRGEALHEN